MKQEYTREYVFENETLAKVCQDSSLCHGGTVWDAALVMCAFLESQRALIANTDCIELGAGTAIVSIAASLLGARKTVATDLPEFVPFMKQNVGLNLASNTVCEPLDWNNPQPQECEFDWVLCADCVYDSDTVDALTRTIIQLNPKKGVILSNEAREAESNAAAEKKFIASMLKNGFVGKGVHKDVIRPDWRCDDIHIVLFEKTLNSENVKGG